jgi:FK506-binding protein 2
MRLSALSGLAAALISSVAADDAGALKIEVTHPVSCVRKSQNFDVLSMNYKGTLLSGKQFDSNYGKEPFKFKLGTGNVIKGWDQGLLGMCIGEQRKLTIPPQLAYGSRDMGEIPPNSVLGKDDL